jgi:choline dehydrogenase-like flavoprotein
MIVDGREPGFPDDMDYAVAVIGAGPAGITIASELEGSGLRCALIESGGFEFHEDTQALYDGAVTGLDLDLTSIRLRMLGGTSNHWGGRCLPLDEIDFERGPGNGMSGWPFARALLDPFYARAMSYCDIGEYEFDLADLGVGEDMLLLADHPCVTSEVTRQSPPTRFGEKYLPLLRQSGDTDLWLWTNAVHLATDPDGRVTYGETKTLSGQTHRFRARAVIVACGAVENARLILASNRRNGKQFGDASGLVGACYMDHPAGVSGVLQFSSRVAEKAYWAFPKILGGATPLWTMWRLSDAEMQENNLRNAQFALIPMADSDGGQRIKDAAYTSLLSLKNIVKRTIGFDTRADLSMAEEYCKFVTNADSLVLHQLAGAADPTTVSRVRLEYEAEQLPDRSNRVSLADGTDALGEPRAQLHWHPGEDDIDTIVRSTVRLGRHCGEAGLGRVQLAENQDEPCWGMKTGWHQLGTTRMAESETSGVVDPDLRVHGTQNLFVAGGSVFPTGGRANPTLTIVALSIRLADHLKLHLEAT